MMFEAYLIASGIFLSKIFRLIFLRYIHFNFTLSVKYNVITSFNIPFFLFLLFYLQIPPYGDIHYLNHQKYGIQ